LEALEHLQVGTSVGVIVDSPESLPSHRLLSRRVDTTGSIYRGTSLIRKRPPCRAENRRTLTPARGSMGYGGHGVCGVGGEGEGERACSPTSDPGEGPRSFHSQIRQSGLGVSHFLGKTFETFSRCSLLAR
jgi:hypothetical protein